MQRAIDESKRRRDLQLHFNEENNIIPTGVSKKVLDVMEGAFVNAETREKRLRGGEEKSGAFEAIKFDDRKVTESDLIAIENEMFEHVKNLAFEEAAQCRDRIAALKIRLLKQ